MNRLASALVLLVGGVASHARRQVSPAATSAATRARPRRSVGRSIRPRRSSREVNAQVERLRERLATPPHISRRRRAIRFSFGDAPTAPRVPAPPPAPAPSRRAARRCCRDSSRSSSTADGGAVARAASSPTAMTCAGQGRRQHRHASSCASIAPTRVERSSIRRRRRRPHRSRVVRSRSSQLHVPRRSTLRYNVPFARAASAPCWCKPLATSGKSRKIAGDAGVFHKVFHRFCEELVTSVRDVT